MILFFHDCKLDILKLSIFNQFNFSVIPAGPAVLEDLQRPHSRDRFV